MKNTPTLQTKRLILRKFKEKDIPALYKLYHDAEVNRFLPWFPIQTITEAKQIWKQHYHEAYQQVRAYRYAICLRRDDVPIGYVHISMDSSYDLGYALCKEYWHNGIVIEACKAVMEQVRMDGIPYLTATHDINNPNSGAVMKHLGMQYQYSYEEQWQPKQLLVTFRMYQINLDDNQTRVYMDYWNQARMHCIEPYL